MTINTLDQDLILTRAQIAAVFDVTPSTIRRWEERCGFPVQRWGKKRMYHTVAVRTWVTRRRDDQAAA